MKQFITAFNTEGIKLKHSGIQTTAYILAVATMLINIAFVLYDFFSDKAEKLEPTYIFVETYSFAILPFIKLFYPLIIIVTAARLAQLEHKNNTWQLMETQPVKRAILLNAKFLKAYQICFFSIVLFMVGIVVSSYFTYLLSPKTDLYILNIDWLLLIKKTVSLTLGTGFLLALIYAISIRFSNLFISIIVGVGILLVAPILSQFNLVPKCFPTTILNVSLQASSDLGYWLTYNEYLSIIATIIILFIATFWYVFKSKKWWITNKQNALLNYAIPVTILLALFVYVNKPTQLSQSNETVIKGSIPKDEKISALYLLDDVMNDTLQIIKVQNNAFNHAISLNDLPLKKYRLAWKSLKGEFQFPILFSKNDIVEIQFPDKSKNKDFKVLGTRLAENSLNIELGGDLSYIKDLASKGDEENYEIITFLLKRSYNDDLKTVKKFHTADNLIVRNDYNEIILNELYYKYNLIWLQYKDAIARKNDHFKDKNKSIQEILNIDFTPNEDLVAKAANVDYFRFKIYDLLRLNTSEDDIISKYQKALEQIKNQTQQTQLTKVILNDNLNTTNDLAELNRYETAFLPLIKEPRALNYYTKLIKDKKRITNGNIALSFNAITTTNQPKTLEDFKGKYVIIDFWASWCGPCLYQADFFEKHAIEYNKRGDVVFVSLSVDQTEAAWRTKVKLNDKNVTQLFATNQKELSDFYRLNSIPRFIVIDPEGKIINSSFAFPNDSNFKVMLDQILPKK